MAAKAAIHALPALKLQSILPMRGKAWMAAFAAMTAKGQGPKLTKVFCGAFLQKSDRLLSSYIPPG
jgi:hypothetical protein